MSIVLTLISGKGGSGKTTIGLAIAKLLSKCEKKVLLVDCDTSTHGATYFFESALNIDDIDEISTTKDFLENKYTPFKPINPIKSISDMDFIPSMKRVLSENNNFEIGCSYSYQGFKNNEFANKYDLIIFDCQAGYDNLTKSLIKISDVCLFVLEADAVSAAAMRALYTQLSSELTRSSLNSYQVFNKLSESELTIYSNIKYGTFFTNLKPVLFDWSVRNAFQENMIPLVNENNPSFTSDICNLTRNLFPAFKEEILNYEISIKNKYLSEEKEKLHKINQSLKLPLLLRIWYIITLVLTFFTLIILILSEIKYTNLISSPIQSLIFILCLFSWVIVVIYEYLRPKQENKKRELEFEKLQFNVKTLEKEIDLLTDQIKK
ncbi:MAG: ParA family protein [Ruminococcus sp.]|nr:ParA family protein [Ruminococcus sp.]